MSKPLLAILIPTIVGREHFYERLMGILNPQVKKYNGEVKIITLKDDKYDSTGTKRNTLVSMAYQLGAKYISHHDDDDVPAKNYVEQQLLVAHSGLDCGSLLGSIYFDGVIGKPFHHSIEYDKWFENTEIYARCPNHLNALKIEIAMAFPFPDKTVGEDGTQSEQMAKAGAIKTQYNTQGVIYHYFTGNRTTELEASIIKSLTTQ